MKKVICLLCLASLTALAACAPPAPPPPRKASSSGGPSATTGSPAPASTKEAKPAPEQPAPDAPAPEKPAPEKPAAESPAPDAPAKEAPPAVPAAEDKPAAAAVPLGSPELTAGIPGDGPLTEEAIQQWLAVAANHVPLQVQLPLGLAAGQSQVQIPADNPLTRAKIELGRQLYFDPRLSADGSVSCASCHHPDDGYARHTQFGVGINGQMGGRNSPVSYNRLLSGAQFWDGRAGSLEAQAVGPIANPIEMGNTHEKCVETLKGIEGYKLQFEKIFPEIGRAHV